MPNHVMNEVVFYGNEDDVKTVMSIIGGDEKCSIDFNRIIPMPDELDIEEGSALYSAMDAYLSLVNPDNITWSPETEKIDNDDFAEIVRRYRHARRNRSCNTAMTANEISAVTEIITENSDLQEVIKLGRQGITNLMKYGAISWYDWRCNHWGTKWNAYEQDTVDDDSVIFRTAWSMPEPIYRKLAEICAEHGVRFMGQWCNEDWRNDSGCFESDGSELYVYRDETDDEAAERCRLLWKYDPLEEEDDE